MAATTAGRAQPPLQLQVETESARPMVVHTLPAVGLIRLDLPRLLPPLPLRCMEVMLWRLCGGWSNDVLSVVRRLAAAPKRKLSQKTQNAKDTQSIMPDRRPLVRLPASTSHYFDTRAIFCRSRFSFSLAVAACRPYSSPTILLPILLLITGGRGRGFSGVSSAGTRHTSTCGASFASAFALGAAATNKSNMFRRSRAHTDPTRSISTVVNANTNTSNNGGAESKDELPTKWDDIHATDLSSHLRKCVPPLTSSSHKGSSGRVGVLGGSARYTGAPYYAAMAALRTGADLAFVFCAKEAEIPIKSYSPELMVASVYNAAEFDALVSKEQKLRSEIQEEMVGDYDTSAEKDENSLAKVEEKQEQLIQEMVSSVVETFDRLHVLIIGPGLGRCPLVLKAAAKIIAEAKERKLPMVIDADGLYLLTLKENAGLVAGYDRCVLTPNAIEVRRLTQAMVSSSEVKNLDNSGNAKTEDTTAKGAFGSDKSPPGSPTSGRLQTAWADSPEHKASSDMTAFERSTEGIVIVKKGPVDVIFSTTLEALHVSRRSMLCKEEGGLKRSGGIGDILSGCIGTFVAWNRILPSRNKPPAMMAEDDEDKTAESTHDNLLLGVWTACCITRRATRYAFEEKRRGMTAPDVLHEISRTVDEMTGSSIVVENEEEV